MTEKTYFVCSYVITSNEFNGFVLCSHNVPTRIQNVYARDRERRFLSLFLSFFFFCYYYGKDRRENEKKRREILIYLTFRFVFHSTLRSSETFCVVILIVVATLSAHIDGILAGSRNIL